MSAREDSDNRRVVQSCDDVLGIFAKQPVPGLVKTRLAAQTSPEWAARVADAFIRDTLERLEALPVRRLLVYSPLSGQPYFQELVQSRYELVTQADGDLGQRIESFFAWAFAAGAKRAVLIGADSPSLPADYVTDAFHRLQHADLVIGPACDGGFYLFGARNRLPPLFRGVRWGGSTVLTKIAENLMKMGQSLAVLPPWYDVDTIDDWQALVGHLAVSRKARLPGLPATERLIAGDFASGTD